MLRLYSDWVFVFALFCFFRENGSDEDGRVIDMDRVSAVAADFVKTMHDLGQWNIGSSGGPIGLTDYKSIGSASGAEVVLLGVLSGRRLAVARTGSGR